MDSILQREIKQGTPFASLKEEVWLNLLRTTAQLCHDVELRLRPFGLSTTQYNVLRILRGAGPHGLCQYEIKDRLVAAVPDVPRILERMEKAGWVRRVKAETDKRLMMSTLTSAGTALAARLDDPVLAMMADLFQGLSEGEMKRLNELLVAARRIRGPHAGQVVHG